MRRLLAAVVLTMVAAVAPGAHAAPKGQLRVTGNGGQSAVLEVGRGGLVVEYPFFRSDRIAGPDGAVGGVVIQEASSRKLVGGQLLENVPGFDQAIELPLVDFEATRLRPGRYELTLLGAGKQSVTLDLRGRTESIHLSAKGHGRPLTRTVAGDAVAVDRWTADLGRLTGREYVVAGAGGGGTMQQGEYADFCVRRAEDPCSSGGSSTFLAPGAGDSSGWSALLFRPGSLRSGSYSFEGTTVGAGAASTVGHAAAVISLR